MSCNQPYALATCYRHFTFFFFFFLTVFRLAHSWSHNMLQMHAITMHYQFVMTNKLMLSLDHTSVIIAH